MQRAAATHFGFGREMIDRGNPFLLKILPIYDFRITSKSTKLIHPLLKRSDGKTFVFFLKAGATMYRDSIPITDPLFSATVPWITTLPPPEKPAFYVLDREAAAIGSLLREKFRSQCDDAIVWNPVGLLYQMPDF
jgi:hypothetical protein